MTFKLSRWLHFIAIISFVFSSLAVEVTGSSQTKIPLLFESAASFYNVSTIDLDLSLPVDPISKSTVLQLKSSASQSCFGMGSITFYGSDFIRSGEKKFDFGTHRLYFRNTISKFVFSVGAGYDFDNENDVEIEENTTLSGSSVSEKKSYLLINDWEENTFLGNINGSLIINDADRLLLGFEMAHSTKNGIEYSETAEFSTDMYQGFQDNIACFIYDNGAYRNRLAAGTGLLHEYVSRRGYERLRLVSLNYQQTIEHSNLSPIYDVRSYFFSNDPDNIQFSGKNHISRSIALDALFSERFPDKVYLEHAPGKAVEMYLKYLKFGLQYAANSKSIVSINQWNMNDVYYGVNERTSKHYPLSVRVHNVTECILFRKFRVRFDSHLDGMIERYSERAISGKCVFALTPALGCTLPIGNSALLDVNYFFFPVTTGFEGNKNSSNFGLDVTSINSLQVRIAILK